MKFRHFTFLLCGCAITFWGCPKKKPETQINTPPTTENTTPPPANTDVTAAAKDSAMRVLTAYYNDLAAENIDETKYFAPKLGQFFKKNDMPREDVAKIIRAGFATVENRKVVVNPSSVTIHPTDDGYTVEFEVDASYTRSSDKKVLSEKSHNRVNFDKTFRITSYANADEKGAETNASGFAELLLESLGNPLAMNALISPEKGVTFIYRPGAISDVKHYKDFTEILEKHAYLKTAWQNAEAKMVAKKIKEMGCDELDNLPKGEAWMDEAVNFQDISREMKELNKLGDKSKTFDSRSVDTERGQESVITHRILVTNLRTAFYFGKIGSRWYLLAIDTAKYSCDA